MTNFTGVLNANELRTSLFNQIISIDVYATNIKHTYDKVLNANRVDGSLYGDTKVYTFGDLKHVVDWAGISECSRLLETDVNQRFTQKKITLDKWKMIVDTTQPYMDKRAWLGEGGYGQFITLASQLVAETKRVYLMELYNAFIGTHEATSANVHEVTITVPYTADLEARNRLEAQKIAETIANLYDEGFKDVNRDYNEYGYRMSFDEGSLFTVLNAKYANKITKMDIPTIYHNGGLDANAEKLPSKFFGAVNTSATVGDGSTVRSLVATEFTATGSITYDGITYASGDTIPVEPAGLIPTGYTAKAGESYTVNAYILGKIIAKGNVPFMTGMNVEDNFHNARGQADTKFVIFGYNTLDTLGLPYVTLKVAYEDAPAEPETPGEGEQ